MEAKRADHLFTFKDSQPGQVAAIDRLLPEALPPAYQTVERECTHGRVTWRTSQTAPVPARVEFPSQAGVVRDQHTADLAGAYLRTEIVHGHYRLNAA